MLIPTGMAEADPLASNNTVEGMARTGRVAVNVLVSKGFREDEQAYGISGDDACGSGSGSSHFVIPAKAGIQSTQWVNAKLAAASHHFTPVMRRAKI